MGDSQLLIFRQQKNEYIVHYKTPELQHYFNCPYQLTRLPDPSNYEQLEEAGLHRLIQASQRYQNHQLDHPKDAQYQCKSVKAGDIIVAGSDGLFDNLFEYEIANILKQTQKYNTLDFEQKAAENLVEKSIKVGLDNVARTPFSVGAKKNGQRFSGGKLDDTTVLVSSVTYGVGGDN